MAPAQSSHISLCRESSLQNLQMPTYKSTSSGEIRLDRGLSSSIARFRGRCLPAHAAGQGQICRVGASSGRGQVRRAFRVAANHRRGALPFALSSFGKPMKAKWICAKTFSPRRHCSDAFSIFLTMPSGIRHQYETPSRLRSRSRWASTARAFAPDLVSPMRTRIVSAPSTSPASLITRPG